MTRIFHVSYNNHHKSTRTETKSSVILIDMHPLMWAVKMPRNYNEYFFTTLNNWTEVAEKDVPELLDFLLNQKVLNVEDYRGKS